jgi:dihydropyrimidine dehydrogenase (NAD+) subunit PreT
VGDIRNNRLPPEEYARNFADSHPPLARAQALVESDRCYFCFDAPCVTACPTGIDIPSFIRKIGKEDPKGAAKDILTQNIMGSVCARVCPTEVLCEGSCVRTAQEERPVRIGALQRYATDWLFDAGVQLFKAGAPSGKKVAVVGGGPAGLSGAHRLAMLGHSVTVFEGREKLGGLNEYGVAAYKVTGGIAQHEVDYLLAVGNIKVQTDKMLGRNIKLAKLRREYDAVFLGMGLAGVNGLGINSETLDGVYDAIGYIGTLRQTKDLSALPVGRRVVVIGGGMTAIDIACQTKRLGAEEVTIVYRRGEEQMGASHKERDWAQTNGVLIRHWARPMRIVAESGMVGAVEFEYTRAGKGGKLTGTGEHFTISADMVFKAIGQALVADPLVEDSKQVLEMEDGRIAVDDGRHTSLEGVWAGGDCVAGGPDLTVAAVEDGKQAALSIDAWLRREAASPAKSKGGSNG